MKLIQLRIRNIASIEDACIDFACGVLANAPLFLICGPTGSGKTTLLDAICLALYKATPRMNNAPKERVDELSEERTFTNDNEQLMRRNTAEAWSELDFEGIDGMVYTAKWYLARARKNPLGKLQAVQWTLENQDTHITLVKNAEVKEAIERVVGLNFEQFCRTSMLAQGDFTKFLKSDAKDKSEILEKLTGTKIYASVGAKIYKICSEKELAYKKKKEAIGSIPILDDAKREALNQSKKDFQKQIGALGTEILLCRQKSEWLTKSRELESKKQEQAVLLKGYIAKTLSALGVVSQKKKVQEDEKADTEKYLGEYADYLPIYEAVELITSWLNDISEQKKTIEKCKIAIAKYQNEKSQLEQKQEDERLKKEGKDKEKDFIQVKIEEIDKAIEKLNPEQVKNSISQLNDRLVSITAANGNLQLWKASYKSRDTIKQENNQNNINLQKFLKSEKEESSNYKSKKKEYDQCLALYNKQKEMVEDWSKEARASLELGDICPVCGQTIDQVFDNTHFQSILEPIKEALDKSLAEKDKAMEKHSSAQASLNSARTNCQRSQNRLIEAESDLKTYASAAKESVAKLNLTIDKNIIDVLNNLKEEVTKAQSVLNADQKKIDDLNKDKKSLLNDKDLCIKDIDTIVKSLTTLSQKITENNGNILSSQQLGFQAKSLIDKKRKWILDKLGTSPYLDKLRDNEEEFLKDLSASASKYKESQEKKQRLDAAIQQTAEIIESLQLAQKEILERFPQIDVGEISAISQWDDSQNSNLVNTISISLALHQDILDGIVKLQNEKPDLGEEDNAENLSAKIKDGEEKIAILQQDIGKTNQQLQQDENCKQALDKENEKLKILEEDYLRWSGLNKALGSLDGSVFRRIAQSFVLEELLCQANKYLARLSDRYSLSCNPGSLSIQLHDAFQGGVQRPATTLSGGESFIVSLSLALALSSLGQHSLSVDTLFIDEGFGSLSIDNLDAVIGTLKRLHDLDGKRVGIISHIEFLRNSIPIRIEVRRIDNSKSGIEIID